MKACVSRSLLWRLCAQTCQEWQDVHVTPVYATPPPSSCSAPITAPSPCTVCHIIATLLKFSLGRQGRCRLRGQWYRPAPPIPCLHVLSVQLSAHSALIPSKRCLSSVSQCPLWASALDTVTSAQQPITTSIASAMPLQPTTYQQ